MVFPWPALHSQLGARAPQSVRESEWRFLSCPALITSLHKVNLVMSIKRRMVCQGGPVLKGPGDYAVIQKTFGESKCAINLPAPLRCLIFFAKP